MGCKLADQLARLMGGTISAFSVAGAGTRIAVQLPIYAVTQRAGVIRRLNILAVDDVALNLMLVCSLVGKQHNVTTASSGTAALKALEQSRFDVVLMDVQMPDMDGLKTTGSWRSVESARATRIPFIAVTANASAQDCSNALEAGMDDFLSKPVDRQLLHFALWRAMSLTAA